jgi:hypothetical protein
LDSSTYDFAVAASRAHIIVIPPQFLTTVICASSKMIPKMPESVQSDAHLALATAGDPTGSALMIFSQAG